MNRTRFHLTVAVATGLALALLSYSCAVTSNISGSISGIVKDSNSSNPIQGATVECAGLVTSSDTDGSYTISGIPPGDRVLYASASGYESYSNVVSVGEATRYDIMLDVFVPPARLYGHVAHATFGALEGASVQIGDIEVVTDSLGFYEFPNLFQQEYDMTVTLEAYRQVTRSVRPNSSDYLFNIDMKKLATMTFPVVADAAVFLGAPDANAGVYQILQLFDNGIQHDMIYITFSLEGIEATAEPVSATLRLYHTEAEGSEALRTLMAARVLYPWSEETITWNYRPQTTGPAAAQGQYVFPWYEAEVGEYFTDWLVQGSTNNGLLIDTPNNHEAGRFYFASREYHIEDAWPHVVLDYAW